LGAAVARINPRDPKVARDVLAYLVASGLLDRLAADRAAQAQQQTAERVDTVIIQLGLVSEQVLLESMSSYFNYPLVNSDAYPLEPVLPGVFRPDFLKRCRIVLLASTAQELTIATADPFASDSIAAVGYQAERTVRVCLGHAKDVELAIDRIYGDQSPRQQLDAGPDNEASAHEDDVQRLQDLASEAPVIRLVNRIIVGAIEARASDIHIEPLADSLRVRWRIDGVLHEMERLRPELQAGVASRVKIIGKLNIADRRMPQDGRAPFAVGGREVDLRISTAPLLHGESIVLRILDRDAISLDLAALGFEPHLQTKLKALLDAPNGIILVTGPTGSGKTTTLYAALKLLNSVERKVFTVEDPIEYQLAGVNQMQIKPTIELDFVHCLRSILRQDPDIVMIGEMRDVETVRTGIQASLTGHLVLSTLHTNSAAASITRLLDMGTEDYLLASTVSGILAQRLVRKLCTACAEPDDGFHRALDVLDARLANFARSIPHATPKRSVGCPHCRQSGFHGRTTIAELLIVDTLIRQKIVRGVADRDIETLAREHGMESLLQDGLRKVARGETTLAEVLRVARM
jgi:general secretion pathway protein E